MILIIGAASGEGGNKMPEEFMDCSRAFNGKEYHDHITITMCNMGQYNEENYSQYLTIKETKELIKKLQRLVELK